MSNYHDINTVCEWISANVTVPLMNIHIFLQSTCKKMASNFIISPHNYKKILNPHDHNECLRIYNKHSSNIMGDKSFADNPLVFMLFFGPLSHSIVPHVIWYCPGTKYLHMIKYRDNYSFEDQQDFLLLLKLHFIKIFPFRIMHQISIIKCPYPMLLFIMQNIHCG